MKVWILPRAAGAMASPAQSMSPDAQRARAAITGRRVSFATRRTASASSTEAIGNPASMMSTPRASS
jgi:hypothetical protein